MTVSASSATACPASSPTSTPRRPGSGSSRSTRVDQRGRPRPRPLPHAQAARAGPRAARSACRRCAAPTTSTRSRRSASPGSPATSTSSAASARTSAGTPRSWSSRANRPELGVGGHIATYAVGGLASTRSASTTSSAARTTAESGDQVFFQGHALAGHLRPRVPRGPADRGSSSTGSGRSSRTPPAACPSYPHPRLMPDFWEFPTVSHGPRPDQRDLPGPVQPLPAQPARSRTPRSSRVWAFLGDGEMDEPESLGAIGVAAREELDNLTFVVNCNLQRLDGPVRGNGKIIQELESYFRGAGWNVIKVVWGREWDELLARDVDGVLVNKMNTTPDGQFQTYSRRARRLHPRALLRRRPAAAQDGRAPVRRRSCASLPRGGHDYRKVYAAFKAATEHTGQPTVILAHTIKGWTLGKDFEGRNATHQMKKLTKAELKEFRDRLYLEIPRLGARGRPAAVLPPGRGLRRDPVHAGAAGRARRLAAAPGGPGQAARRCRPTEVYDELKKGSGKQAVATTMAFVRLLKDLMKDKEIGHAVRADHPGRGPHVRHGRDVPDGQDLLAARPELRRRSTASCCCPTRSASKGQILHEGITEAGSMALGDRGRHVVRHARRADDPGLHLLLDVRLPAHRRPDLGARPTSSAAASCSAPPPAAPRSTARACSTRTATRCCSPSTNPAVRRLRPGVRLRGRAHRRGRRCAGCTARTPRTSSTT